MKLTGRSVTEGTASGAILKLDVPLSLWGGVALDTATIVDATHPQCGATIAGRIVAMPGARGSSSSSSALVELARQGLAPTGIVMTQFDPILMIGALVATELYQVDIPIVIVSAADWDLFADGDFVAL